GIKALSASVEGDAKYCKQHVSSAVQLVKMGLQDSSQRVKYDALGCLGAMAEQYAGAFQSEFHNVLVEDVISLITTNDNCTRVQGHCVSSLINFYNPQQSAAEQLEPYVDSLLNSLCRCLQEAEVEVQQECLSLVGCIALVIEVDFTRYYEAFMPGIKNILQNALAPSMSQLRSKAMECVGLIGEAVGPELFVNDAVEVMRVLVPSLQNCEGRGAPEEVSTACARICKALKQEFLPFLPLFGRKGGNG
ncbi:MAG: hypothetical protein ACK8QZ_11230, partial [Anaerolineales bacterium]